MRIKLHDPVVVSQAPLDVKPWGPWQFPVLQRLDDGQLLLEFHQEADSATSRGLPKAQATSADEGRSWQEAPPPGIMAGLRLPNGDLLRALQRPSLPVPGLELPAPLALVPSSYGITYTYYRRSELPADLQSAWWFRRRPAGHSEWVEGQAGVESPDDLVYSTEEVLVRPAFEQDRIHVAPHGELLATQYALPQMSQGRLVIRRFLAKLVESLDNGRTWRLKSSIPYHPDPAADPSWDARDGFTEPQIAFQPDGSLLALLRTTDGNGVGPMYVTHSEDGGTTWETPAVFDNLGVWPQLLTLDSGVTLASYGRPGLYLRASTDPAGRTWDERLTVVPPGTPHRDTCSYSALIALPDGQALLAYSDFNVADDEGRPRKTILTRRIEVN